jgi:cardiolipin synthase
VRVLVDANGGKKMGKPVRRLMQEAGCQFAVYHPWRLKNIGVLAERDHRKITVIDGGVAFVGGHCIVDDWLGNAERHGQVRDVSVRLRGPIVHAVQSAFSENWVEETGELFMGEDYFRKLEPQGSAVVHLASVKPEGSAPAVKILHHLVICCAQKRLWIQNPYFIPEPDAIEAFAQAVKRGVDVRIMVPSAGASDMKIVQHAAHRNFDKLLAGGVRLFEYQKTLLHQKVMTVDGIWCSVGSSNFDDRSFETNDEITLGFQDAGLARQLEEIFEHDRKDCIEIEAAAWAQRGIGHRIVDNAWYLFNELL